MNDAWEFTQALFFLFGFKDIYRVINCGIIGIDTDIIGDGEHIMSDDTCIIGDGEHIMSDDTCIIGEGGCIMSDDTCIISVDSLPRKGLFIPRISPLRPTR